MGQWLRVVVGLWHTATTLRQWGFHRGQRPSLFLLLRPQRTILADITGAGQIWGLPSLKFLSWGLELVKNGMWRVSIISSLLGQMEILKQVNQ